MIMLTRVIRTQIGVFNASKFEFFLKVFLNCTEIL